MARILRIDEFSGPEDDGFLVSLDVSRALRLGISNYQFCCEDWGYFMSEDDFDKYIGADLLKVEVTDTGLNTKLLPEYGMDDGDVMFVNLHTTAGLLQFVAYNAHNGYYGHRASVRIGDVTIHEKDV